MSSSSGVLLTDGEGEEQRLAFSVYISNYCFYPQLRDQRLHKLTDKHTDGQIDTCMHQVLARALWAW